MSSGYPGVAVSDLLPSDGGTPAPGTGATAGRYDHVHRVVTAAATPAGLAVAAALGAVLLGARADHQHPNGVVARVPGLWHTPDDQTAPSAAAAAVGVLYAVPWDTIGETLSGIGVYVDTANAALLVRLGLAYPDANNKPGARAADFGTVSGATTGFKSLAPNVAIPAGFYFLLVNVDVGGGFLQSANATNSGSDRRIGLTAGFAATDTATAYKATGVAAGGLPANMPAMVNSSPFHRIWTQRS